MQKLLRLSSFFMLIFVFAMVVSTPVMAAKDLDSLNGGKTSSSSKSTKGSSGKTGDETFDSITDYMRNHEAVTDEDMEKASRMTSPITNFIGQIIGIILLLTNCFVFLITALDIMYIAVPFLRHFLNPAQLQSGGGAMPGMGMGRGMGMGMGGMGMGGGAQQGADPNAKKWVSDEAVAALMETGMMQGAQGGGAMGGMGMGGMGGMGMGGMGMGGQQQQQPQGTKQAITVYLKKRIFFLIFFAIATTTLMSSVFLDCGLNLGKLLYEVMEMLNGGLSGVEI